MITYYIPWLHKMCCHLRKHCLCGRDQIFAPILCVIGEMYKSNHITLCNMCIRLFILNLGFQHTLSPFYPTICYASFEALLHMLQTRQYETVIIHIVRYKQLFSSSFHLIHLISFQSNCKIQKSFSSRSSHFFKLVCPCTIITFLNHPLISNLVSSP